MPTPDNGKVQRGEGRGLRFATLSVQLLPVQATDDDCLIAPLGQGRDGTNGGFSHGRCECWRSSAGDFTASGQRTGLCGNEDEVKRAMLALQAAVEYADQLDAGLVRNGTGDDGGKDKRTANGGNGSDKKRGPRPVPLRTSITQCSSSDLVRLIGWLSSDEQLRTDDEIVSEMVSMLGFSRRGARIEAAVRNALQIFRTRPQ